jgi:hypothetical protein
MLTGVVTGIILMQNPVLPTEITIYNQGFALVKQVRKLTLASGQQTVKVEDVASQIEPNSVGIRSIKGPKFEVLEQNYQFDLISPIAVLNKSVGKKIRFIRTIGGQRDRLEGTLLSAPIAVVPSGGGSSTTFTGMVLRTDDGRIVLDPTGEVEVASVPEGLISVPTLVWELASDGAGETDVELSYLTQGIRWESDYVLTLSGNNSASTLQGWVTINNQSGGSYTAANLKLLAGDVARATPKIARMEMMQDAAASRGSGGNFQQQELFEYHLYTLQRPATVLNREIKQIALLSSEQVRVDKKLIIDAMMNFRGMMPQEGEVGTGDVRPLVQLAFVNNAASGLGMPLPKGTIKVYQRDGSGSVQMLGEDSIDHTAREETIRLNVGRSFDVVSNRKRTEFMRLSNRSVRETFEIEVRNRKQVPETVYILERPWQTWKVTKQSQDFEKLDSNTIQFKVDLAANEVKKVTYTVETSW